MEINYKKTKLDKNFAKFTINDDCMVVGDTDNISKLFNYFNVINDELSNTLMLDTDDVLCLQQAQSVLNGLFKEKRESITLNDLFFRYIDYDTDPLARLISDEVRALLIKYGTEEQLAAIPTNYRYKDVLKNWLQSNVGKTYEIRYGTNVLLFLNAKAKDVDYHDLQTTFGKSKYRIDRAGGLKTLFRYAKERRKLDNVEHILSVTTYALNKYLRLYGFDTWKEWICFADACKNWDDALDKIKGINKKRGMV